MTTKRTPPSLTQLVDHYRRAQNDLEDARLALIDGIRTEYAAGMRQADIVRGIDHVWSDEYVRKIVKGLV
ncbi:hypothetical protein [Amycolatopsis pithecellobii]|uniref:Uncharacterized protein n=1 Tax=Amycolatopsis pithecellobii TaxID=664692 RepID=A0A6N7Z3K4_9PSEU|nr:hypothetical protein [Amycolatopsis pithecellobii]MTD55729.1 hypothetical protein [Amycolatopsis pithecellobii]